MQEADLKRAHENLNKALIADGAQVIPLGEILSVHVLADIYASPRWSSYLDDRTQKALDLISEADRRTLILGYLNSTQVYRGASGDIVSDTLMQFGIVRHDVSAMVTIFDSIYDLRPRGPMNYRGSGAALLGHETVHCLQFALGGGYVEALDLWLQRDAEREQAAFEFGGQSEYFTPRTVRFQESRPPIFLAISPELT